jgi:hypothetical protein
VQIEAKTQGQWDALIMKEGLIGKIKKYPVKKIISDITSQKH